jgi:hypothetical protein
MKSSRFYSAVWAMACAIIAVWVVVMAYETFARVRFPWDTYYWPESPFLTDLLKLHNHLPVYAAPADGNSFVYSPGLEYLCFTILQPFGLELDIRYCRLVDVVLGLLAAVFAALAIGRMAKPKNFAQNGWVRFLAAWGLVWLVLSKNNMADVCHPDNLQAFHAASIFYLTLTALETRRFGLGVATIIWAGLGVFSKQTEAVAFLGPALVFAWFNPWGWKRLLVLAGLGAVTVAASVYLLWSSKYGRFYTYDLLTHQGFYITKLYHLAIEMLTRDRGLLLYLAIIAGFFLWDTGVSNRRQLICWAVIGFFSVMPNLSAYLKSMGGYNNLILFEIWFSMIAWAVFLQVLDGLAVPTEAGEAGSRVRAIHAFPVARCVLMIVFLLLLLPTKRIPTAEHYAYCQAIEDSVRKDLQAGRKVLVSHGTEYLIRAGMRSVPLDRCNSILELNQGGKGSLSEMPARIQSHYYDRIYLVLPVWYGVEIPKQIAREYVPETVIKEPKVVIRFEDGFGGGLMEDCVVMVPRTQAAL